MSKQNKKRKTKKTVGITTFASLSMQDMAMQVCSHVVHSLRSTPHASGGSGPCEGKKKKKERDPDAMHPIKELHVVIGSVCRPSSISIFRAEFG